MTTACQHEKFEQVHIKIKCGHCIVFDTIMCWIHCILSFVLLIQVLNMPSTYSKCRPFLDPFSSINNQFCKKKNCIKIGCKIRKFKFWNSAYVVIFL